MNVLLSVFDMMLLCCYGQDLGIMYFVPSFLLEFSLTMCVLLIFCRLLDRELTIDKWSNYWKQEVNLPENL